MTDDELRTQALTLRRSEWALIALFAVIIVGLLYFVGCRIVPFEPYTSYDYEVLPERVCVGDTVRVAAERSVDGTHPLDGLSYDSEWRPVGNQPAGYPRGFPQDAEDGDLAIAPTPRDRITSRAPRTVPTVTGDWVLVTELVVYGLVGGVGREQVLTVRTDKEVTVEPEGSEYCSARSEQEGVIEGA